MNNKPLILVVDDEKQVADTIAQTIRETDRYQSSPAYSAKEALELMKKNKRFFGIGGNNIRFVFLDIKMPGMDGLELLAKLRQQYGEDLGACMLTAWEDEEKWDKATSGFVVNYIRKPFKSEEIIKTLDDYFSGQEGEMVLKTFQKHLDKREEFKKP